MKLSSSFIWLLSLTFVGLLLVANMEYEWSSWDVNNNDDDDDTKEPHTFTTTTNNNNNNNNNNDVMRSVDFPLNSDDIYGSNNDSHKRSRPNSMIGHSYEANDSSNSSYGWIENMIHNNSSTEILNHVRNNLLNKNEMDQVPYNQVSFYDHFVLAPGQKSKIEEIYKIISKTKKNEVIVCGHDGCPIRKYTTLIKVDRILDKRGFNNIILYYKGTFLRFLATMLKVYPKPIQNINNNNSNEDDWSSNVNDDWSFGNNNNNNNNDDWKFTNNFNSNNTYSGGYTVSNCNNTFRTGLVRGSLLPESPKESTRYDLSKNKNTMIKNKYMKKSNILI